MNLDPMGTLLPPETERIAQLEREVQDLRARLAGFERDGGFWPSAPGPALAPADAAGGVHTILMEKTSDLVWTADVDLRNTYVSPSVERILGFTPREHLERDVSQQMTPESVVRLQRLLRAQLELERQEVTGAMGPLKAELEYYRKDGSTIWLENQIGGIRDANGSMTALHAVARDVSDRRKAQQALEESERRYRVLAENASDIIWTTDADLNITYSSPSAERLLGYDLKEITAVSIDRRLAPGSLAVVMQVFRDAQKREARRPGSLRERLVEIEVLRRNGSSVWMEVAVNVVRDGEGRITGYQGVCRDVTGRRRAEQLLRKAREELAARVEKRTAELRASNRLLIEEIRQRKQAQKRVQESEFRYRELVENASCVIMELDTRGRVCFFNRFARDFYGFEETEIMGRHMVGTIVPKTDSAGRNMKAVTADMLKHPERHFVMESEGRRLNGEQVWLSWTNKGLYDEDGRLRHVLCIGMDTTEQRKIAGMLAEQVKEKAAVEERQRLARDLHDAVTQNLFSASLIAEVLPRLWKKDRREAEHRLGELRRLTRGALAEMRLLLLELRPLALSEVGLFELLRQLVDVMRTDGRLKVTLRVRGTCGAPGDVQVALYRVAQEALNNVVKHSGATEVEIRLTSRRGAVELAVSDNGSGFDPGAVPARSLGIRIMRERLEGVGATLAFETQPGRGATVKAAWPSTS